MHPLKAYGMAIVLFIAAILGFVTPAADGSAFVGLPLVLVCLAVATGTVGVLAQVGPVLTKQWIARRF